MYNFLFPPGSTSWFWSTFALNTDWSNSSSFHRLPHFHFSSWIKIPPWGRDSLERREWQMGFGSVLLPERVVPHHRSPYFFLSFCFLLAVANWRSTGNNALCRRLAWSSFVRWCRRRMRNAISPCDPPPQSVAYVAVPSVGVLAGVAVTRDIVVEATLSTPCDVLCPSLACFLSVSRCPWRTRNMVCKKHRGTPTSLVSKNFSKLD